MLEGAYMYENVALFKDYPDIRFTFYFPLAKALRIHVSLMGCCIK